MKIKFTESRKGYHVADTDADVYLGQVVQNSTWQTRNKRDRVYWTALVGALGRPLLGERGQLLTFPTRKAAVAALVERQS